MADGPTADDPRYRTMFDVAHEASELTGRSRPRLQGGLEQRGMSAVPARLR